MPTKTRKKKPAHPVSVTLSKAQWRLIRNDMLKAKQLTYAAAIAEHIVANYGESPDGTLISIQLEYERHVAANQAALNVMAVGPWSEVSRQLSAVKTEDW